MKQVLATDTRRVASNVDVLPAFLDAAANTANQQVVPATAGKKIRVLQYTLMAGSVATNVTFKSSGGTQIVSVKQCGANGGVASPPAPDGFGWFETLAGEALQVTTGPGSQVGVDILYMLV